jgi:hypothetical protein
VTAFLAGNGNSHGGCVTLAYAAAHPDRLERFVVTNAPPRMDAAYADAVTDAERRFGHFPEVEAPERFSAAVTEFLSARE